jgi:signal transduction histidine kinase
MTGKLENRTAMETGNRTPIREAASYRKLWFYSVILTAVVAITPLIIMTLVHYHQYQKAVQTELIFPLSRMVSNTKRSIESVIKERRSALKLVINEKSYLALNDEEGLQLTFKNLKETIGGFIDLGVIDERGDQFFYVGPYNLKGVNYRDQQWFHEVSLRSVYVSEVFMGYRNFPHFVIAVKHEQTDGSFYVLRATIDLQLLIQQIQALDLGPSSDYFLINREGVLQTDSRFHGNILGRCSLPVPNYSPQAEIVSDYVKDDESLLLGYAYIEGTPFILVTVQNQKELLKNWMALRNDPIWFLIGSSVLIVLVVLGSSTYMVNRIRISDENRAKLFHNIEYTNKMASIGRLAASVAHEINNPLAIINEKAGLLKDMATFKEDFTHREKVLELVESIQNSVERCSTVTHRLLGFAKRMDVQSELIDLGNLLREVLGFLGKEAEHRNISIHFDMPDPVPTIESDRGQLQQVFLNIINNAFAAVDDGGWIRIAVEERGFNEVAVIICDNGSGILKEDMKRIFEPFFSTKGKFGTGLGLSITRDIVEKLGGKIEVESELGEGTCFTVTLPRTKA